MAENEGPSQNPLTKSSSETSGGVLIVDKTQRIEESGWFRFDYFMIFLIVVILLAGIYFAVRFFAMKPKEIAGEEDRDVEEGIEDAVEVEDGDNEEKENLKAVEAEN